MTTILLCPDSQVKPGVPLDHLRALSNFIVERRPDVIINLGSSKENGRRNLAMQKLCQRYRTRAYKKGVL